MKKQKNVKNKKMFLMFIMVIGLLLTMSIGYSTLHQILYVRGDAKIEKPDYSIYIASVEVSSATNNSYQNSNPTFSNTTTGTYSVLPNTNSELIYKVRIVNAGKTSGILDYTIVNSDNDQIKYKIKGINNGDILAAGDSVDVYIIFEYWDDVSSITNNSISSMVEFQFTQYSDNYSNACTSSWDGSSTSEPLLVDVYGTSYYQISNANEFAWFVNAVNNGSTNINAYLSDNICLNSKYLQINDFNGVFDGQNRKITGFSYSKDISIENDYSEYIGLFKNNNGIIKNLNLAIDINDKIYYEPETLGGNETITQYVGGLVSSNSGKISNVLVDGSLSSNYNITTNCAVARPVAYYYIAGIAGSNSGVVTGSVNKTVLNLNFVSGSKRCNYRKSPYLYGGGVVGQNSGYISDSYNNTNVSSTVVSEGDNSHYYGKLGGVVGEITGGNMINVYNSGSISHNATVGENSSVVETNSGCVVASNSGTISNAYYLDSCSYVGNGTAVSSGDLMSLNISIGNFFMRDISSLNSGYPILGWQ